MEEVKYDNQGPYVEYCEKQWKKIKNFRKRVENGQKYISRFFEGKGMVFIRVFIVNRVKPEPESLF